MNQEIDNTDWIQAVRRRLQQAELPVDQQAWDRIASRVDGKASPAAAPQQRRPLCPSRRLPLWRPLGLLPPALTFPGTVRLRYRCSLKHRKHCNSGLRQQLATVLPQSTRPGMPPAASRSWPATRLGKMPGTMLLLQRARPRARSGPVMAVSPLVPVATTPASRPRSTAWA